MKKTTLNSYLVVVLFILSLASCASSSGSNAPTAYDRASSALTLFRHNSPAFTVEYGTSLVKATVKNPHVVLAVKTEDDRLHINVTVNDAEEDARMSNCPNSWIEQSKTKYPNSSDYKIVSKRMVTLNDGTKACDAMISYKTPADQFNVSYLFTVKDNKQIEVFVQGDSLVMQEYLTFVTQSFKFLP